MHNIQKYYPNTDISQHSYIIHKTLRKPCNILGVISGKWYPNIDSSQYLFNNHTYFDLYRFVPTSTGSKFVKFYQQFFMSKVYSVCTGPTIKEVSSFFALRDSDIIQFVYSSTEEIFVRQLKLNLQETHSFSNYMYYSNPILFVSAACGSIAVFDFTPNKPIFIDQKTPVLNNFLLSENGFIGRIEGGPSISIYDKEPFKLRSKRNFSGMFISNAFEIENRLLAVCTTASIKIVNMDDPNSEVKDILLPLIGTQTDTAEKTDFITDVAHLDASSNLLLSALGKVFLMQGTNISLIYKDSKISQIFPLTDELVLFTMKGYDHIIRNVKKKTNYSKIRSCVGQNGFYLGSQIFYLAPHTFSFSSDLLLIGKQGVNVRTLSFRDCSEPIYGLHSFNTINKNYIVVSFQNSSQLLEITDTEIKPPEKSLIKENAQTLGVCPLLSSGGMSILFQVTTEGLYLYKPQNGTYETILSRPVSKYASNSKQIILFIPLNNSIYMLQLTSSSEKNSSEQGLYNLSYPITAMDLSKPDPTTGLSEYIAYGVYGTDLPNPAIEIHTVSLDQAVRSQVISEKMPSKVESIKFVNCTVGGNELTRIVAGLDDGTIVVGNVDFVQRVIDKVSTIQFGSGPCHLTPIFPKSESPAFMALNSRPVIVHIVNGVPRFIPVAITSAGYATAVGDKNLFILASGTIISASVLSDIDSLNQEDETSMTVSRCKFNSKIVSIAPIPCEKFVFIATPNSLFLFDSYKTDITQSNPLAVYNNELVRTTCSTYQPERNTFLFAVGTIKRSEVKKEVGDKIIFDQNQPKMTSIIRLYTVLIANQSVQLKDPIIGECKMTLNSLCIASQSTVFAGCGDMILCFRQKEDTLQVVARMSGIGTCIKHLVYIPPLKNGMKGEIYAGDVSKSVKLLRFSEKSKQFKLKAEEGAPRHITALARYEDRFICGGDILGNIFILEYPQIPLNSDSVLDKEIFNANRRLSLKFNFFVGDSITGVQYTRNLFSCLWYSTVSGGLGGFISVIPDSNGKSQYAPSWKNDFANRSKLMKRIEMEVSYVYSRSCECDHIIFRNKFFPSTNVIDMDMVELYLMLSDERKMKIAANIADNGKGPNLKPTDIEIEINKFRKYFIEWHTKI